MISKAIRQSLFVVVALVIVCVPVQGVLLNGLYHLPWKQIIVDVSVTLFFLSFASFAIINILTFYHPTVKQLTAVAAGTLLIGYLVVLGIEQLVPLLSEEPLEYLSDFNLYRIVFSEYTLLLVLASEYMSFGKKSEVKEHSRRKEIEKIARDAELASLRQQLQPHFLFNSLNSINALIGTQPEKARKMVQQLSDFLRGTIKKDDSQLVSLFDEMSQLKLYLEIEKVRFGHRLAANIDNENGSLNTKLPPLLIQPVVENAIKFGLYDTVGETIISIKTRVEQNYLVIQVENPFDPATSAPRHGTGFGLSSLQRRLYLLYARNDLLTTSQIENTFITQIKIPQA